MTSSIYTDITRWIKKVSVLHEKLGNKSLCPFAKNAKYHIVKASALDVDPVLIKKEVCIFVVPDNISKAGASFLLNCINPDLIVFKPSYLA